MAEARRGRKPLSLEVPPPMQREASFSVRDDGHGMPEYRFQVPDASGGNTELTLRQQGQRGFNLPDFVLGPELGRGEGGGVRIALHRPSNTNFALKEITIGSQANRHQLGKELQTHMTCGAMQDIVQLFDVFYDEGRVYLVLELMDWGSLEALLHRQVNVRMDEGVLSVIIRKITSALHFLHDGHSMVHRDLKPGNVVLNCAGVVKLSDFGVSRVLDNEAKGMSWVGTASYMSPERLMGSQYSHKADIWSLGIMAIECAIGRHPYLREDGRETVFFELMQRVVSDPPPIPQDMGLSGQLVDFLQCCLTKEEERRAGARELLQHPFLTMHADKDEQLVSAWLAQFERPKIYDDEGREFSLDGAPVASDSVELPDVAVGYPAMDPMGGMGGMGGLEMGGGMPGMPGMPGMGAGVPGMGPGGPGGGMGMDPMT